MNTHRITSGYRDWETIAVAIVLMATGLFLLGGDLFGILSLDRIQNLWPVALIVGGVIDLLSHGTRSQMVSHQQ
ncbi:MAG TPA: hypothetical protein VHU83_16380 [Bryobacteraceae bacterium]|jgi:hypothetical protein|nr:hypothetical protein [Bryobacteraceae bacterium]